MVDGVASGWQEVLSSVLQGSVLGGILFNIFIDDLEAVVRALIKIFADDTKVARIVESEADARELQRDIDRMYEWADKWKMAFNIKKCRVMHIGKKNNEFEYYIGGANIESAKEEKDLGVWVESTLKPTTQCESAAKNGNAALGLIMRVFHYRTKSTLVPLYKTFVRPKLEYAAMAWSPWLEKDMEAIEKVQKRMVRMLSDVRGGTYEEKLKEIGMTTLKDRRTRGDLIETYKTLSGLNNVERDRWFQTQEEQARPTRANTEIVDGQQTRKDWVLATDKKGLGLGKRTMQKGHTAELLHCQSR